MSQSPDDRLQFSINESVWLKDEAPAEEILSMALEPDITVEESRSDVTIKGFLRLTGEYKPAEPVIPENDVKAPPFRTIDEIIDTGSGTAVLEHHFPIDITIPADRVSSLEDLFVIIDSFDYELTEQRHIQLQADIAITGLKNPEEERKEKSAKKAQKTPPVQKDKKQKPEQPAAEKKSVTPPEKQPEKKDTPPVKKAAGKKEKKKDAEPVQEPIAKKETPVSTKKEIEAPVSKTEKPEVDVKSEEKKQPKPSKPAGKEVQKYSKKKREEEQNSYNEVMFSGGYDDMPTDRQYEYDGESGLAEFNYETFRKPDSDEKEPEPLVAISDRSDVTSPSNEQPTDAREETDENQEPAEEQPHPSNSQYLTKVLTGDEAEQKTKLKICIVQSGDSLESISERYHVPVTSLLRKNELTTANIEAGEILYIPKTAKGSKNE